MFSERLAIRYAKWWAPPTALYRPGSLYAAVERFRQRRRLLSREDSMQRWRRGAHWQRRLNNKWNAREFAAAQGVRVPELYWWGRDARRIPFAELPSRYVIRSTWGAGSRQVYLLREGYEQLRNRPIGVAELRKILHSGQSKLWAFPWLVEEYLESSGSLDEPPLELSFHAFRGEIAALSVAQGRSLGSGGERINFYTPEWEPTPEPLRDRYTERYDFPRPRSLSKMLACAQTLGRAYDSYVRVDLFDTNKGCVFGEFASYPGDGIGFSDYAEQLLGEYWTRYCDDCL